MNDKLHSFPKKSITFKTATLIVIGAHVLAIVGVIAWSNHNSAVARQKRLEESERRMARPSSTDWPKPDAKPQVVAKPSPTPRKEPTKSGPDALANNAVEATKKITEAVKTATEAISQTKVTEKLKEEFLKTKDIRANFIAKEPPRNVIKSTRVIKESNKSPVIETFERQVISSSSNDIIISPQTVKTYVSNGIHYIQLN